MGAAPLMRHPQAPKFTWPSRKAHPCEVSPRSSQGHGLCMPEQAGSGSPWGAGNTFGSIPKRACCLAALVSFHSCTQVAWPSFWGSVSSLGGAWTALINLSSSPQMWALARSATAPLCVPRSSLGPLAVLFQEAPSQLLTQFASLPISPGRTLELTSCIYHPHMRDQRDVRNDTDVTYTKRSQVPKTGLYTSSSLLFQVRSW